MNESQKFFGIIRDINLDLGDWDDWNHHWRWRRRMSRRKRRRRSGERER